MPLVGFSVWMQSGLGDIVAIQRYKSWTTLNYGVNRSIWRVSDSESADVRHTQLDTGHACSLYTTTATTRPMNSYILISAESERRSKEEADTGQLGED